MCIYTYKAYNMATQRLSETLFENTDKIPEGLYLELMNISKEIFEENQKKTPVETNTLHMIRYIEPWFSNEVGFNGRLQHKLNIHKTDGFRYHRQLMVDDMLQLCSLGNDKVFLKILKINKCSITCYKIIFRYNILGNWYSKIGGETSIKFAVRYEAEGSGISKIDLSKKEILFYDISSSGANFNFQQMENIIRLQEQQEAQNATN